MSIAFTVAAVVFCAGAFVCYLRNWRPLETSATKLLVVSAIVCALLAIAWR